MSDNALLEKLYEGQVVKRSDVEIMKSKLRLAIKVHHYAWADMAIALTKIDNGAEVERCGDKLYECITAISEILKVEL